MVRLVRNPPLDDPLVSALVRIWVAVTNVGGAVGFYAPVTSADVRPLADATFARVRAGAEDLVVAYAGERPVGFGFLARNANPYTAHWATIARLQRDPTVSGAGIGASVLAELEALAADHGLEFVVLTVRGNDGGRERFYLARGYRVVATHPAWLKFQEGVVHDELVLVKRLRGVAPPPALRVQRLDPDLPLPAYSHAGDAGLDLRARSAVTLPPGDRAVVGTGIAVAIPPGHVGLVHPRSGLAARHGLALVNAPGTIDSGYRGEIKIILVNLDPHTPVTLHRGDRIAQLLIQPVLTVTVEDATSLDDTPRGAGGFGSTGQ